MNRREFLRVAAGGLVFALQAACQSAAPRSSAPQPSPTLSVEQSVPPPAAQVSAPTPDPDLAAPKLDLPLPLQITPLEQFYVTTFSTIQPGFDPKFWAFSLDGLVAQPLKFNFEEMRALPALEVMRTLECIGNPVGGGLVSNATWKGTSLKELLQKADVKAGAKYLIMDGADEYFTSVPIELGLSDEALLVYEMNGQLLPPQHGQPLRVLLPGVYGQKQPKWITHIGVADHYEQGPWEKKGWSDTAIIRPNARIDRPIDDAVIKGKRDDIFTITGIAFCSSPGVARVEVSTDEGATWNDTVLTRAPSPFTNFVWTRWGFNWQLPERGQYTLLARVTDRAGNGQSEASFRIFHDSFPDGTNAIHSLIVKVE
ncbi:MAG TPA: molybdopterin-dependent oxidoreductase [Anaerolineae bacterium]